MGRTVIILLLLLMVFFGGVSYGSKEPNWQNPNTIESEVVETYPIIEVVESEPELEPEPIDQHEEELAVYRTASLFEKVVATFYDTCISIMYQFVSLFFD